MSKAKTLTATEAQQRLGVASRNFVYTLLRSGRIEASKNEDGAWAVSAASVDAYLKEREFRKERKTLVQRQADARAELERRFGLR